MKLFMDKKQKTLNETTVKLRKLAFFPPFIILIVFVTVSIWNQETFLGIINTINNWIIGNLGWAASVLALVIVIVLVWAAFSDFGKVRIGGKDAKPELSTFHWFTIVLCTTMAAGILFWGPGEPIAHFLYPPTELYDYRSEVPTGNEICNGNNVFALDSRSICNIYIA